MYENYHKKTQFGKIGKINAVIFLK